MAKRRPNCSHRIDQERYGLYCRRGQGHEGDHAYWSAAGRVEWNDDGMVLAQSGFGVWRPGKVYEASSPRTP